jgi:hypothetical protein
MARQISDVGRTDRWSSTTSLAVGGGADHPWDRGCDPGNLWGEIEIWKPMASTTSRIDVQIVAMPGSGTTGLGA